MYMCAQMKCGSNSRALLIMLDRFIKLVRQMRRNASPDQSDDRNRIDLESVHDRDVSSLVLSSGRKQIGVPVIAQRVVRIALNGASILAIGSLPVAVEVQQNIRQRSMGLGQIGIKLDRFQRRPPRRRHGFGRRNNLVERQQSQRIGKP